MEIKNATLEGDELVLKLKVNDFISTDTTSCPKRMYCLVLRQLSPIQKGVQSAHSIVEYSNKYRYSERYIDWSRMYKTIVMLDGGVLSELEDIVSKLEDKGIDYAVFKEEDLGNILTSISIVADYNVYDKKCCPDFEVWRNEKYPVREQGLLNYNESHGININDFTYNKHYSEWVDNVMGGENNVFLRELLMSKRLSQ